MYWLWVGITHREEDWREQQDDRIDQAFIIDEYLTKDTERLEESFSGNTASALDEQ